VYGTFAERASSCRGWRRLAQRAGRACSNLVPPRSYAHSGGTNRSLEGPTAGNPRVDAV